jgi:hypothetical protein
MASPDSQAFRPAQITPNYKHHSFHCKIFMKKNKIYQRHTNSKQLTVFAAAMAATSRALLAASRGSLLVPLLKTLPVSLVHLLPVFLRNLLPGHLAEVGRSLDLAPSHPQAQAVNCQFLLGSGYVRPLDGILPVQTTLLKCLLGRKPFLLFRR